MKKLSVTCMVMLLPLLATCQQSQSNQITVKKTADFEITGDGDAKNWETAEWVILPLRQGPGEKMITKAKVLYSDTGIYFLFDCPDRKITSKMNADFMDLWTEDVVEVFLWTDESAPAYFEYEISPMNYELPILISNDNGDLVRWMPFHYDADRKTRHATTVRGGEKRSNASITAWTTEFFIPFKLLRPLENIIPKPGTKWRANMYRVDYDDNTRIAWTWQAVNKSYHDYQRFGTFLFE